MIPHLFDEDEEVQDLARREGMFDELEDTCGYWQQQISTAIEQQLNKTPIVSSICLIVFELFLKYCKKKR